MKTTRLEMETLYGEDQPVAVRVLLTFEPDDWYEIQESDAWKEVERLVSVYGTRGNLIQRLVQLGLSEEEVNNRVHDGIYRYQQEHCDNEPPVEYREPTPDVHRGWLQRKLKR